MKTQIKNDVITRDITIICLEEYLDLSDADARRAAENELLRLGEADRWYFDGVKRENYDEVTVHFTQ